jgi:hypothetical protein
MRDHITHRPIQVSAHDGAAFILVAAAQLAAVRAVLDQASIPYQRSEGPLQVRLGMAVIALTNATDADRVRALLDAAP